MLIERGFLSAAPGRRGGRVLFSFANRSPSSFSRGILLMGSFGTLGRGGVRRGLKLKFDTARLQSALAATFSLLCLVIATNLCCYCVPVSA